MIKINLLPQKRPKKRGAGIEGSTQPLIAGIAALAALAVVVVLLVDRPKRSKLAELQAANQQLSADIASNHGSSTVQPSTPADSTTVANAFVLIRRIAMRKSRFMSCLLRC